MIIIGVTGSFGTGKTTVAGMFTLRGAEIIDADKIARELLEPESEEWSAVLSCFGREILNQDKSVNRTKLADKVFAREEDLKKLCDIMHPGVIGRIKKRLRQIEEAGSHKTLPLKGRKRPTSARKGTCARKGIPVDKIVIIDAPLLIEAGLAAITDKLIVVKTDREKQLSRCQKRTGLSEMQIENRIKNQLPLEEKIKLADYVIDNNGTLEETLKQVEEIWKKITKM